MTDKVYGYLIKPIGMPPYEYGPIDFGITKVEMSDEHGHIQELIGCEFFDVVTFNEHGDGIFIDDVGAVRQDQTHKIVMGGLGGAPFAVYGSGLILGVDRNTGESTTPVISMDELHDKVSVHGINKLPDLPPIQVTTWSE